MTRNTLLAKLAQRMFPVKTHHHLNTEAANADSNAGVNHGNGGSAKTVMTLSVALPIAVPRDRCATFEPALVAKHQRKIINCWRK